ncbi:hypothetical protein G8V07_14260 [Clostridium botulinum D/C]|uniref:hypothetical protein n=1 Tax=Clostridium botulinum TaxID=1491 RepID=UPI001E383FE7|nr:hypothetical protein [Clostridium botulinum]MCD3319534.1 hypothetical protein [Clostridium botulinum D/C]MCD3324888.1 hypothetical protein [Clostridium botulinum D/C]MCD3327718.1 hypothetical protein [Clostridium botulinum D/C]
MNDKEFFITIKNDLYNNANITNEELVVLAIIKKNYNNMKELSLISINFIMNIMCVFNRNPKIIQSIRQAIKGLIEKQYIKGILNITYDIEEINNIKNNDLFYVEVEKDLDSYFCVNEYDLDLIFNYLHNTNINKFAFVRYYIAIQRVINNDAQFGWLTQSSVKNIINHSQTIAKYNEILANELNLIIYNNSYMTQERKYCSTYFARYGDDVNFNKQLQFVIEDKHLIYTSKTYSNLKRSNTLQISKEIII